MNIRPRIIETAEANGWELTWSMSDRQEWTKGGERLIVTYEDGRIDFATTGPYDHRHRVRGGAVLTTVLAYLEGRL